MDSPGQDLGGLERAPGQEGLGIPPGPPTPSPTPAAAGTRHCRVPPDRSALLLPSRLEVRSLTPSRVSLG